MPPNTPTFYEILKILPDSTPLEIKKAYRAMTMKWHPDKNNNSPESNIKTQQINEAYATLTDTHLKEIYDKGDLLSSLDNIDVSSLFSKFQDIIFMYHKSKQSNTCEDGDEDEDGDGDEDGDEIINERYYPNCPILKRPINHKHKNPKHISIESLSISSIVKINMSTVVNGGVLPLKLKRNVYNSPSTLEFESESETVYVSIPTGIDDGEIIIIKDKGHIAFDGTKGIVKVFIQIENNTDFNRQGIDLIFKHQITLMDALCGFSFQLHHLNGKTFTIRNKRGCNIVTPGFQKVIPNLGLLRNEHIGNMIITFDIIFPTMLTDSQCDLIGQALHINPT
jgi:DnaJ family protein B protein 4